MFNGYHDPALILFNDFEQDNEKKQENGQKWTYGKEVGVQSTHTHFNYCQTDSLAAKPNFLGISNNVNLSTKCNCSECYSSENQCYQVVSGRHRPWLPKTLPFSSNEPCKLSNHRQWNNVSLMNQGSCFQQNSIPPQIFQGNRSKYFYYQHCTESNQPGVITSFKNSRFNKKEFIHKQNTSMRGNSTEQEQIFFRENDLRQPEYNASSYNGIRNLERRFNDGSCDSNFFHPREKYSFDQCRLSNNTYSFGQNTSKSPVTEPYMKAVPSNSNQTKVPSIGHRNIIENTPQLVLDQSSNDSRKNIYYEPCQNFNGIKGERGLLQKAILKDETGSGKVQLGGLHARQPPMAADLKNNEFHVDYAHFNVNRDFTDSYGNTSKTDCSKILEEERQTDYFYRANGIPDSVSRNTQGFLLRNKKNWMFNNILQVSLPNNTSSNLNLGRLDIGSSETPIESDYSKGVKTDSIQKFEKYEKSQGNLVQFSQNEKEKTAESLVLNNQSNRFDVVSKDLQKTHYSEKPLNFFEFQSNSACKNYTLPEYSSQGSGNQDSLKYSQPLNSNDFHRYDVSQHDYNNSVHQVSNVNSINSCNVHHKNYFISNSFNNMTENQDKQFSQPPEKKNQWLPNTIQTNSSIPEKLRFDFTTKTIKTDAVEMIHSDEINKSGTSKISPLRLLRKKKFLNKKDDIIVKSPVSSSTSETSPGLDVRKFWSTWAEEEEENVSTTPVVIIDCQNIDPEEAKLLNLYGNDSFRTLQFENSTLSIKRSEGSEAPLPSVYENIFDENKEKVERLTFSNPPKNKDKSEFQVEHLSNFTQKSEVEKSSSELNTLNLLSNGKCTVTHSNNHVQTVPHEVRMEKPSPEILEKEAACFNNTEKVELFNQVNNSHTFNESHCVEKLNQKLCEVKKLDKNKAEKINFSNRNEKSEHLDITKVEEAEQNAFQKQNSFQESQATMEVRETLRPAMVDSNNEENQDLSPLLFDGQKKKKLTDSGLKLSEDLSEVLESFSPFLDSQSNSPVIGKSDFPALPTSEYRRNKFLNYCEEKFVTDNALSSGGESGKEVKLQETDQSDEGTKNKNDLFDESYTLPVVGVTEKSVKEECSLKNTQILSDQSLNSQSIDFEIELDKTSSESDKVNLNSDASFDTVSKNILRNVSKTLRNASPDVNVDGGVTIKSFNEEDLVSVKKAIKLRSSKKVRKDKKLTNNNDRKKSDTMKVENISVSKPTIKFSIQKSHDLKISFKVLNGCNLGKKFEIDKRSETNCSEKMENNVLGMTDPKNTSELITLKLKSVAKDDESLGSRGFLQNDDLHVPQLKKKKKRKIKTGRLQENQFLLKRPLLKIRNKKETISKEDNILIENLKSDFQVEESVDSAKIKLTFKRQKSNLETEVKLNDAIPDPFKENKSGDQSTQEIAEPEDFLNLDTKLEDINLERNFFQTAGPASLNCGFDKEQLPDVRTNSVGSVSPNAVSEKESNVIDDENFFSTPDTPKNMLSLSQKNESLKYKNEVVKENSNFTTDIPNLASKNIHEIKESGFTTFKVENIEREHLMKNIEEGNVGEKTFCENEIEFIVTDLIDCETSKDRLKKCNEYDESLADYHIECQISNGFRELNSEDLKYEDPLIDKVAEIGNLKKVGEIELGKSIIEKSSNPKRHTNDIMVYDSPLNTKIKTFNENFGSLPTNSGHEIKKHTQKKDGDYEFNSKGFNKRLGCNNFENFDCREVCLNNSTILTNEESESSQTCNFNSGKNCVNSKPIYLNSCNDSFQQKEHIQSDPQDKKVDEKCSFDENLQKVADDPHQSEKVYLQSTTISNSLSEVSPADGNKNLNEGILNTSTFDYIIKEPNFNSKGNNTFSNTDKILNDSKKESQEKILPDTSFSDNGTSFEFKEYKEPESDWNHIKKEMDRNNLRVDLNVASAVSETCFDSGSKSNKSSVIYHSPINCVPGSNSVFSSEVFENAVSCVSKTTEVSNNCTKKFESPSKFLINNETSNRSSGHKREYLSKSEEKDPKRKIIGGKEDSKINLLEDVFYEGLPKPHFEQESMKSFDSKNFSKEVYLNIKKDLTQKEEENIWKKSSSNIFKKISEEKLEKSNEVDHKIIPTCLGLSESKSENQSKIFKEFKCSKFNKTIRRHSFVSIRCSKEILEYENTAKDNCDSTLKCGFTKKSFPLSKSCPFLKFSGSNLPAEDQYLNIPLEQIPLPLGDPLPENCFNIAEYVKKNNIERKKRKTYNEPNLFNEVSKGIDKSSTFPETKASFSDFITVKEETKEEVINEKNWLVQNKSNREFESCVNILKNCQSPFMLSDFKTCRNPSPPLVKENEKVVRNSNVNEILKSTESPGFKSNAFEIKVNNSFDQDSGSKKAGIEEKVQCQDGSTLKSITSRSINFNGSQMCVINSSACDIFHSKHYSENLTHNNHNDKFKNHEEQLSKNTFISFGESGVISKTETKTNINQSYPILRCNSDSLKSEAVEEGKNCEKKSDLSLDMENSRPHETVGSTEFYQCEDIPTSEDLPSNEDDIEEEKASDEDEFQNMMQNCLENAKKFLNDGSLNMFSSSVEDLLNDCTSTKSVDDNHCSKKSEFNSTNHISRDVLLASFDEAANDNLDLSKHFQTTKICADFISSLGSENLTNLCTEILPVDNWPYLEEEVPSSPSKSIADEPDLILNLENSSNLVNLEVCKELDQTLNESTRNLASFNPNTTVDKPNKSFYIFNCENDKLKSIKRVSQVFGERNNLESCKRFRRSSFASESKKFQLGSISRSQRRKTVDSLVENHLCYHNVLEKEVHDFRAEIVRLKNGLEKIENLWQGNKNLKCEVNLNSLKTLNLQKNHCKERRNSCSQNEKSIKKENFSYEEVQDLKNLEKQLKPARLALNNNLGLSKTLSNEIKNYSYYNSSKWQPKVMLFRISKKELKLISKHQLKSKLESNAERKHITSRKNSFEKKASKEDSSFSKRKLDSLFDAKDRSSEEKTSETRLWSKCMTNNLEVDSFENFQKVYNVIGEDMRPHSSESKLNKNQMTVEEKSLNNTSSNMTFNVSDKHKNSFFSSGSNVVKRKKSRFRNLHSKKKSYTNQLAKEDSFSAEKNLPKKPILVETENILRKIFNDSDPSEEQGSKYKNKSTKIILNSINVKKIDDEIKHNLFNCRNLYSPETNQAKKAGNLSENHLIKRNLQNYKTGFQNKNSMILEEETKTDPAKSSVFSCNSNESNSNVWKNESHLSTINKYEKKSGTENYVVRRCENSEEHRKNEPSARKDKHREKTHKENKNKKHGTPIKTCENKRGLEQKFPYEKQGKRKCEMTLSEETSMSKKLSHQTDSWSCEVCGFKDASERVGHIKNHPFHCQSCHLAFKTEAHFINHLKEKHKDIRNQHHCLLCELSFDTNKEYQQHLETREHKHLESVEKNTINTLFTLLTGQPCPVLGVVDMKPEWLPSHPGTVHFYHQATPLSLALQYLKMHHEVSSCNKMSATRHS